ncbi:transglycosylase [Dimargaris verticillata]|uniref:Transglycosylase n=1 Tax=Dimargaris verticillata TaxID=2761393 RepID=A0A9W8AXV0_9FUNG|nr:transglycosylase [Dimargaris verticillata]
MLATRTLIGCVLVGVLPRVVVGKDFTTKNDWFGNELAETPECWSDSWSFTDDRYRDYFSFDCEPNISVDNGVVALLMNETCFSPTLIYNRANIHYGMAKVLLKPSKQLGAVTALVRGVWGKGEIDYEFTPLSPDGHVQSVYYVGHNEPNGIGGLEMHGDPTDNNSGLYDDFHEYGMEYTPEHIRWLINGVEVRKVTAGPDKPLPKDAYAFNINVWNAGATFSAWAGKTNWTEGPHVTYVKQVSFDSYCEKTKNMTSTVTTGDM